VRCLHARQNEKHIIHRRGGVQHATLQPCQPDRRRLCRPLGGHDHAVSATAKVDVDGLQRQVSFRSGRTTCVCRRGTTGESPHSPIRSTSGDAAVVEAAAGRIKVMAGTGSNSTDEALGLTRWAAKAKVDAPLIVTPVLNSRRRKASYQHFKVWPRQSIYHLHLQHPRPDRQEYRAGDDRTDGRTPQTSRWSRSRRLARPSLANHHATDLTVLSGDDSLTLPLAVHRRPRRGLGRGQYRAPGRDRPRPGLRCWRFVRGPALAPKLFPLCRDMLGLSTNPIPIKAAMRMLGRDTGELRMPLVQLKFH